MNNHPGNINQVNSGFMAGGMQAAVGNNNTQSATAPSPCDMATQHEVAELILQIKQVVQSLSISESAKEDSIKFLDIAKSEVEEEEPDKEFVSKNLERAAKNIGLLEKTLDSGQQVMEIISPLFRKSARWLGPAAHSLIALIG
ncbi:MAG: hypothetical protein ACFCVB_00735 [Nodosilinea sp.]